MEQPTNPTAMTPAVPPRKSWAVDRRERRLLPLSFALAYLCASFLLEPGWNRGFGVTALAAGWYAALFLYRGAGGMERRANRVLLGAVALLAMTFTIFSNQWFRWWNFWALLLLIAVHTWELCGGARLPWYRAGMLVERTLLLARAPFVRLGAAADTVKSFPAKRGRWSWWVPVLAGVAVTLPLLWVVTMVLMDADALFALVVGDTMDWLALHLGMTDVRLFVAVCGTPFLFSALYFAAHTETKPRQEREKKEWDSLPAVILLGALDTLYLFFLAVQGVALFGDRAYLQRAGISFAEYARSGFFQLVYEHRADLNGSLVLPGGPAAAGPVHGPGGADGGAAGVRRVADDAVCVRLRAVLQADADLLGDGDPGRLPCADGIKNLAEGFQLFPRCRAGSAGMVAAAQLL